MPQFSSDKVPDQELLVLGPFSGLDATSGQYFVDNAQATNLQNIVPDRRYQSYVPVQGRVAAPFNTFPAAAPGMFFKFKRPASFGTYLFATYSSGAWSLGGFYLGTIGGFTIALPSNYGTTLQTFPNQNGIVAYQQNNSSTSTGWAFFSPGQSPGLKIDATYLLATLWQAAPPSAIIGTANASSGGTALNGTYYYRTTFSNATLETSPGPITGPINVPNLEVVFTGIAGSADPQITTVNLYRLGGTSGTWTLITSIANPYPSTASYIDNTSDLLLTGQSLVLHRDPPANFISLEVHKDRIWGFGYNTSYPYQFNFTANAYQTSGPEPSDLWYSNYIEPWGFDNTNQVIPIGRSDGGDIAVGLATLGSLLVCFKTSTTWAVYGDTQSDFLARRLFDIGCVSQRSIVKAYGLVYWLSDRGVWGFDGGDAPQYLSRDIKALLDAMSQSDLSACAAFMRYRMLWLSFPTKGFSLGYDLDTQKWWKVGWAADAITFDPDNLQEVTADRIGSTAVDSWFAAETDLGSPISSFFTSRVADSGALLATKQYRYILVEAPIQAGASVTLTLTVNPGLTPQVFTTTVNLGTGTPRHLLSLPPNMVGFECQLTVSVTSSQFTEVQRVAVIGYVKRQLIPQG